MRPLLSLIAAALILAGTLLTGSGRALAETPSINKIKAIVTELGYKPTVSDDKLTIADVGEHEINISFVVAGDKSNFQIYTYWSIPPEKLNAVPATAMLRANSASPFVFGVFGDEADPSFDLEATYDASVFGKALIKKAIAQLLDTVDNTEALWNTNNWQAPAAAAAAPADRSYAALQDEADKAWQLAPISIRRAYFLTEKAQDFGVYGRRPNAVFKRGDKAFLYIEPANYDWGPEIDGMYHFGLAADLTLKGKGNEVDVTVPNLVRMPVANRNKLKNLYVSLDLDLKPTLPLGDYVIQVTVRDTNTEKTTVAELPFTLKE